MKNTIFVYFFLVLFFGTACEKVIFDLPYSNEPEANFESMWTEFDQLYGLFRTRNIDWDSVYQVYRPQVDAETTDEELYDVLVAMLTILDDSHVGILPTDSDLPQFQSGRGGRIDTITDFDLDLVKETYLLNMQEEEPFTYGFLNDDIGYLHIQYEPGEKTVDKIMPDIVEFFKNATGIVVDIRNNTGGEDRGGQAMASYFTDEKRLYMTTSIKDGPGPDDFTSPEEWFIEPKSERLDQPLVLLTNPVVISAAETLCLAMRTLPQLTMLGDTTTGAFSNAINRELPNGWLYSMSIGDWRLPDGSSLEGIGIAPDILIQNTVDEIRGGTDKALEEAIDELQ